MPGAIGIGPGLKPLAADHRRRAVCHDHESLTRVCVFHDRKDSADGWNTG